MDDLDIGRYKLLILEDEENVHFDKDDNEIKDGSSIYGWEVTDENGISKIAYGSVDCDTVNAEYEFMKQLLTDLESLRAENERLRKALEGAMLVVNSQAEDEGFWFINATASEAYLQQGLRKLHTAIEAALEGK